MPRGRKSKARGRLSMTSLIDVIFLLLLFFMLSSTFSRFGEIDIRTGGRGAAAEPAGKVIFARLDAAGLTVNGAAVAREGVAPALEALRGEGKIRLVLAVAGGAQAQGLADALRAIGQVPHAHLTVLE